MLDVKIVHSVFEAEDGVKRRVVSLLQLSMLGLVDKEVERYEGLHGLGHQFLELEDLVDESLVVFD